MNLAKPAKFAKYLIGASAITATVILSQATTASAVDDPSKLLTVPDRVWDVDEISETAKHTGAFDTHVWDLHRDGEIMYVAGDFLKVISPTGEKFDQPFLAAFDVKTGDWIDTFRPVLDRPAYDVDVTPDGKVIVGGELQGGVNLLHPATGRKVAGFKPNLRHSWGRPAIHAITYANGSIYVGGRFISADGKPVGNMAKLNPATGAMDPRWAPTTQGFRQRVWDIGVDMTRNRVYIGGEFSSVNSAARTKSLAILHPNTAAVVSPNPAVLPAANGIPFLHTVEVDKDLIHYGGKENFTMSAKADGLSIHGPGIFTSGGDHQAVVSDDNTVWIGCHCWAWKWAGVPPQNIFSPPAVGKQPVKALIGINRATGQMLPMIFDIKGSAGVWALEVDQYGRLWAGGGFQRAGDRGLYGLARYSPSVGANSPTQSCTATRDGTNVTIKVNGHDASDGYVVRRQIGAGAWFWRGMAKQTDTFVDSDRSGILNYTVESRVGPKTIGQRVTCTTAQPAGPVPTNLRAAKVTKERVVLNWKANAEVQIFKDGKAIARDSDGWYTDKSLKANTTHTYKVRYIGSSDFTADLVVKTLGSNNALALAPIAACNYILRDDNNQAIVRWTADPQIEVVIQRDVNSASKWFWRGKAAGDATHFADPLRTGPATYAYRVKARKGNQDSAFTNCTER